MSEEMKENPATQEVAETPATDTPETFDRDYVEKLRQENARYRTAAKAAEDKAAEAAKAAERAKMDELEKAKAEVNDYKTKMAELEAIAIRSERKASLAGKVTDAEAAIKLLSEEHLNDDGTVNLEAFLQAYPFMQPNQSRQSISAANPAGKKVLTAEDVRKMTPDQIKEHWEEIKHIPM